MLIFLRFDVRLSLLLQDFPALIFIYRLKAKILFQNVEFFPCADIDFSQPHLSNPQSFLRLEAQRRWLKNLFSCIPGTSTTRI